jgi:hypothetical protein
MLCTYLKGALRALITSIINAIVNLRTANVMGLFHEMLIEIEILFGLKMKTKI